MTTEGVCRKITEMADAEYITREEMHLAFHRIFVKGHDDEQILMEVEQIFHNRVHVKYLHERAIHEVNAREFDRLVADLKKAECCLVKSEHEFIFAAKTGKEPDAPGVFKEVINETLNRR